MNYKIPSPKEIKEKFQKSSEREDPISHNIHRRISRHITWVLLHFTLWAEFIAMMTPVVDILTIFLLSKGYWITAAIFTQLHVIVDCVDGEIARFRATVRKRTQQQNQFGSFVDSMAGMLVFPAVIFSAGYFLGDLFTGVLGMLVFSALVISSAYIGVYFPQKKKKGRELREKFFGKLKTKLGFSSFIQKSLVTLAILFQTTVFIWIFIVCSIIMIALRYYLYRK